MKLFLDDERNPPDGWMLVKDHCEMMQWIFRPYAIRDPVTEISFDHDLGETKTGYQILCWFEDMIACGSWPKEYPIPEFHIHSANPVGRKNMQRAIDSISRLTYGFLQS